VSDLDYLADVVAELRRRIDAQPTYQWATCVRRSKQGFVAVRFDADLWRRDADDNDSITVVSDKLLQTQATPGDRVLVQIHQGNMQALAATRTYTDRYISQDAPDTGGLSSFGAGYLDRAVAKVEGQSQPFNIMPPYIAMNFIIKT